MGLNSGKDAAEVQHDREQRIIAIYLQLRAEREKFLQESRDLQLVQAKMSDGPIKTGPMQDAIMALARTHDLTDNLVKVQAPIVAGILLRRAIADRRDEEHIDYDEPLIKCLIQDLGVFDAVNRQT
jgi:hypothetical protein